MEKFGLNSSNLKTDVELNGRLLEPGESQIFTFPGGLGDSGEWRVKKWFFKKGDSIKPGDIIGVLENKTQIFEFESFVGGKFNYLKNVGQKVEIGTVLFEIKGRSLFNYLHKIYPKSCRPTIAIISTVLATIL